VKCNKCNTEVDGGEFECWNCGTELSRVDVYDFVQKRSFYMSEKGRATVLVGPHIRRAYNAMMCDICRKKIDIGDMYVKYQQSKAHEVCCYPPSRKET